MDKINWKRKLTSRKFWAALASFATMLIIAMGGTESSASQTAALIMAGASVIAYIIGEGLIDAAGVAGTCDDFDDDGPWVEEKEKPPEDEDDLK